MNKLHFESLFTVIYKLEILMFPLTWCGLRDYVKHQLLLRPQTIVKYKKAQWEMISCLIHGFWACFICLFLSKFTEKVRKPSVWKWIMCSDSLFHKNDVNTPQSNSLSSCTHWGVSQYDIFFSAFLSCGKSGYIEEKLTVLKCKSLCLVILPCDIHCKLIYEQYRLIVINLQSILYMHT